jgi:hypothetical protein
VICGFKSKYFASPLIALSPRRPGFCSMWDMCTDVGFLWSFRFVSVSYYSTKSPYSSLGSGTVGLFEDTVPRDCLIPPPTCSPVLLWHDTSTFESVVFLENCVYRARRLSTMRAPAIEPRDLPLSGGRIAEIEMIRVTINARRVMRVPYARAQFRR